MRYLALFPVFLPSIAYSLPQAHKVGGICHAENTQYNYGGVWELSLKGNLICNYWQFWGDDERKRIESQLDEYGELPLWYSSERETEEDEYPQYWEVEDWDGDDWDIETENEGTNTITDE